MKPGRDLDLIAVGEVLIDLISSTYVDNLASVNAFQPHIGGSPANMASNLARLGWKSALIATIGNDGGGQLIQDKLTTTGLDLSHLRQAEIPSTLILVTRSKTAPQFEAYREADCQILPQQLPIEYLGRARLFHTTAFALSREPARGSILQAALWAKEHGAQLSIDANYAQKIWPNREEAQKVIGQYLQGGALAKFSDVDYERLFGEAVKDSASAAQRILDMGAKLVCLTLGDKGAYILSSEEAVSIPVRPIDVQDATGAGDAFWSGFLSGWLAGRSPADCGRCGRAMAELKLSRFGPLPAEVDRALLDQ